jgi:arylsulfatase A-like enzyme
MLLHLWELHWPRKARGQFASPRYGKQLYQRSVAYLDSQLPRILGAVDSEKTLLVVTGDHGEGIAGAIDDPRPWVQIAIRAAYKMTRGLPAKTKKRILSLGKRALLVERDHQEVAGHAALCVYDYLVRVPLIFSAPGLIPEGNKIDTQVRHIDIAPTILDAVGVDPLPIGLQPSLIPAMHGEDRQDRPAITEALQTMLHDNVNRLVGLRTGRFKYITAPDDPTVQPELYDLEADPLERHSLATEQPGLLEELRLQLERLQGANGQSQLADQRMSPEEEEMVRQRLEALGYLE